MKCKWDYFSTTRLDTQCALWPFRTLPGRKGEASRCDNPSTGSVAALTGSVFFSRRVVPWWPAHWSEQPLGALLLPRNALLPLPLLAFSSVFSCHSFPLGDSHSTPAPPQTASLVVITLVSVLFIVRLSLEGGLFREFRTRRLFRTRSNAVLPSLCSIWRVGERREVLVSADWNAPWHHHLPECTLLSPPAPFLKTDLLTCGPWTCGFPGSSTRDRALRKTCFSNASEKLTLHILPCGSMPKWGLVMRKITEWGAEGSFG